MNVNYSESELAFRDQVRCFLQEKYPADLREKQSRGIALDKDDIVGWQKILYEQGWAAVNWPVEYGGTGWSAIEKHVFANELAAANAP
jgi:alkylation response protein AidB-like acyl-CoA dehydrogenase